jgi:hypothetical protein
MRVAEEEVTVRVRVGEDVYDSQAGRTAGAAMEERGAGREGTEGGSKLNETSNSRVATPRDASS